MLSASSRTLLLAGVSIAALTAAFGHAKAADMATKAPPIARETVKDTWAWWIEGGALGITGKRLGLDSSNPVDPKWGAEGAVGFDWKSQALSPWHLSGQFRYGQARRSHSLLATVETPIVAGISGSEAIKEEHWLLDFAVGRDFAIGSSQGQMKFGVRIADLSAKFTALGATTTFTHTTAVSVQQKSKFVGAGPRLGVEGSTALGGAWSLDWLAGAALLIGERTVDAFVGANGPNLGATFNLGFSRSWTVAVPNVDAQLGLSYWVSPALKLTASYRFDAYFGALSTININGNGATGNVDRFYHGPMLRLTYVTSTQSSAAPHGAATSPAVYNWTGLYLGPNVGCGWSRFALSQFALADRGGFSGLQSNGGGCFVGGQLGYNYQFPTNFVAGIEADAAFADITGQGAAVEEATEASVFRHKIADFGTLRGRLGYAYGQALPYVTGGWAWARNSLNVISDAGPNTTATHLHSGWTLGAGIEYAVTPKWSVKGEYLYADLGSKNYAVVVDDNAVPPGANLDLKVHTFKLGANYHW